MRRKLWIMSIQKKTLLKEKEQKLIDKIERAKKELLQLQEKRRKEIGQLACKHGLDDFDDNVLESAFLKLSKELMHEHS